MTVTALLLYHFQTQNALNAEIESQIQVLKLVTSNIYQKLTYFNNLTASIYYNDDIMSCLEKGQATLLSSPDKKRIQPAIDSLMRTDDMILSVSLTTMAGDTLYWNDGYSNAIHINSLDPDFLQKIYAHNGSGVLSNPITHTMTNVLTAFSCQRTFVIFYLLNSDITGGVVHNYAFSCIHRHIGCRQRKCAWNLNGAHAVIVNAEPLLPYTVDLFCIHL